MTKDEVLNSIQLKKRFCKDCNIPITIFDNPYFYERLVTLDTIFHCVEQFNWFCSEMQQFDSEQDYFEYYNSVKDRMISDIKENPAYQYFNMDLSETNEAVINTLRENVGKKNLYVENNDGKTFISIDMKKANFQQ